MLASETIRRPLQEARAAVAQGRPWSYWRGPGEAEGSIGELVAIPFSRTRPVPNEHSTYPANVQTALSAITRGDVEKVVVARREELGPADPVATLEQLERRFPTCWVFAVSDGVQTFLGATPELLMRVRGRVLETCALAGTSAPGDDGLLRSEKDLREHAHVVRAIIAALEPFCDEIQVAKAPELTVLPNVQHLKTPIRATLRRGVAPRDVLSELHPTPAVCGWPREMARNVIEQTEPFERGLYAGAIGRVTDEVTEFVVAIRSALLLEDATYVYAGAGIVAGSNPAAEDAETRAKLTAITDALRFK